MRDLSRRVRKLEAGRFDTTGLVPHSEAWFDYYEARWASITDEDGRLVGPKFDIPLAVVDRAIERFDREQGEREMKALVRRLTRLEQARTPIADLRMQHVADVLWERRQRRLQAKGLPFESVKPEYPPGPYLSYRESLRRCLQERRARQRAEREAAENA